MLTETNVKMKLSPQAYIWFCFLQIQELSNIFHTYEFQVTINISLHIDVPLDSSHANVKETQSSVLILSRFPGFAQELKPK